VTAYIVLLFVVGALLLAAEVFLPGGVAGVIGGLALLAGATLTFSEFGGGAGTLATLAGLTLVGVMLYAELIWLPRTKVGRTLIVGATIEGQSHPPLAQADEVVGKPATALTPLSPSGLVDVGGKRYEAYCRSGHADRGSSLTVVGLDSFRLVVSENKNS
jgi:membrane-bound ClpP family serine protease